MIPPRETAYLRELRARLADALGGGLVGVYLVGSAAMGAYRPGSSDLDVWAVARDDLPASVRRAVARRCDHAALPCPARGLELVVARFAGAAPVVMVNLNDGPAMRRRVATGRSRMPAAHWFTLDAAIARERAVALCGPPPREGFPVVPRSAQLVAVRRSLAWHRRHAPGSPDAVLNALRGARYAVEGRWCSKAEAADWAATFRPAWEREARAASAVSRDGPHMDYGARDFVAIDTSGGSPA
ncbi:hypothetical protein [Miltoncostaea marina]|uniref:hypothetical protein n=1 Tax=Miltoncostaea marina TaxID=2843215 RepID=UPI001C3C3AC4|nr:hypothetical protein [Miltoncostaea marina]